MARFLTGQVSLSATAQALSTDTHEVSLIVFRGPRSNLANAYWSDSGVTASNGFILEPGDERTITNQNQSGIAVSDVKLTDVYVVGTSGDKISWVAWKL